MIESLCGWCVRHRGHQGLTCDAFPEGIPPDVYEARWDHRFPYPGDHGIRFDLDPERVKHQESRRFFLALWVYDPFSQAIRAEYERSGRVISVADACRLVHPERFPAEKNEASGEIPA
jgi:hypothetical protein